MTPVPVNEVEQYVQECAHKASEQIAEDLYNLTFGDPNLVAVYPENIWEDED